MILKLALISHLVYAGGAGIDFKSSLGKQEANPIIQSADGRFSAPKYFALNGGYYAGTLAFEKKHPKLTAWMRIAAGGAHIAVAVHNFGVKK